MILKIDKQSFPRRSIDGLIGISFEYRNSSLSENLHKNEKYTHLLYIWDWWINNNL